MNYILTLTPGSGIGSVVIGLVKALCYMNLNNITSKLYINVRKASSTGRILFTCFLDLEKLSFLEIVDKPCEMQFNTQTKKHELITFGDYTDLWYRRCVELPFIFKLQTEAFNSFWVMKPDVIDYLNKQTESYNNVDLCINIRRGDKITLEPHQQQGSIEEFLNAIKKIPNVNKIFHTSDDYATYIEFKEQNPEWDMYTFCTLEDKGYFLGDLNKLNDPHALVNHVRKFLKEVKIMKEATWFVGTKTTNVGLMVQLLRENNNIIFIH